VDGPRLVPVGAVAVRPEEDRLAGVLPDGRSLPLVEFFAAFLSMVVVNAFRHVSPAAHTPRVSVDRLVLFRESWRMPVEHLGALTAAAGEAEQYLAARRLVAALGLPDRCFVKVATETKPVYVDFTSPLYVASLCTMLRGAREAAGGGAEIRITEMLPTPDQAWVPDADGNRYLAEIRLHVTDPVPAATQVGAYERLASTPT
jgi:hypothetical protein